MLDGCWPAPRTYSSPTAPFPRKARCRRLIVKVFAAVPPAAMFSTRFELYVTPLTVTLAVEFAAMTVQSGPATPATVTGVHPWSCVAVTMVQTMYCGGVPRPYECRHEVGRMKLVTRARPPPPDRQRPRPVDGGGTGGRLRAGCGQRANLTAGCHGGAAGRTCDRRIVAATASNAGRPQSRIRPVRGHACDLTERNRRRCRHRRQARDVARRVGQENSHAHLAEQPLAEQQPVRVPRWDADAWTGRCSGRQRLAR